MPRSRRVSVPIKGYVQLIRFDPQMDSGGPVLWQNPTTRRLVLVGIINYGRGCGYTSGVNCRVGGYVDWIVSVTRGTDLYDTQFNRKRESCVRTIVTSTLFQTQRTASSNKRSGIRGVSTRFDVVSTAEPTVSIISLTPTVRIPRIHRFYTVNRVSTCILPTGTTKRVSGAYYVSLVSDDREVTPFDRVEFGDDSHRCFFINQVECTRIREYIY